MNAPGIAVAILIRTLVLVSSLELGERDTDASLSCPRLEWRLLYLEKPQKDRFWFFA